MIDKETTAIIGLTIIAAIGLIYQKYEITLTCIGAIAGYITQNHKRSQMGHECEHEKDWEEYYEFREKLIAFMESKKTLNGITNKQFKVIRDEIKDIEAKLDKLLFIFITAFLTLIITIILKAGSI